MSGNKSWLLNIFRFCLRSRQSLSLNDLEIPDNEGNLSDRRDFRQKEKMKLPQNKPSRDESSLPRCNTSSMVGSADPRNMVALTQFISSAMRTFWAWLCCTCLFFLLLFYLLKPWQCTKQPWAADPAIDEILHRGTLDSSRLGLFWGNFFFSFWRKSLISDLRGKWRSPGNAWTVFLE